MKNFTAIQNTKLVKGMGYSFKAKNLQDAIQKAPKLLSGEIVEVYSFKCIILLKLKLTR